MFRAWWVLQVVDEEDSIQILRVAANMLNKQSQTANNEWSSRLLDE